MQHHSIPDSNSVVYVNGLASHVTSEILTELAVNAGPVKRVHIPRNHVTGSHRGFAFLEYETDTDARYAIALFSKVSLYGKPIKLSIPHPEQQAASVRPAGSVVHIRNIDPTFETADIERLCSTISQPLSVTFVQQPESGTPYARVTLPSPMDAERVRSALDNQWVGDREISVSFAHNH